MHLEPSDAFDVVEGVGLMAKEALFDAGIFLPGDALVHHFEAHHVMARRGLVILVALLGLWRWLQEACDLPGFGLMTVGTLLAEQSFVPVAVTMAGGAIERLAFRGRSCAGNLCEVVLESTHICRGRLSRINRGMCPANAGRKEDGMIYLGRPHIRTLVLDMAASAFSDRDVEGSRLLGEWEGIRRVASDAGRGFDAPVRSMTALALCPEERVRGRERARTGNTAPDRQG